MLCLRKEFVGRGGWDYRLELEFNHETKYFSDGFDHYVVHPYIESQSINGKYFKTYGRARCFHRFEDALRAFLDDEAWMRGSNSTCSLIATITHKDPIQLSERV